MNPAIIIGAAVLLGGGLVLASSGSSSSGARGLPTDKRFQVTQFKPGMGRDYNGLSYIFDGKPLGADNGHIKAAVDYITPKLAARRAELPANATFHAGDQYSGEAYWFPYPATGTMVVIDEYGRLYDLEYTQSGMWANLWANPLFKAAVFAALAASGYGVAGYAALQAYQMRGSDMSLKNVALTTAKAYVVSQCGPACGAAFDFGVGVMSGKDPDDAAVDAALSNMTPEQRVAYEQGKKAYQSVS